MSSSNAASGNAPPEAEAVRAAVTAATRLYAQACELAGRELPPVDATITTTEAITLACALLRSQDLTPFDMALWFSRGASNQGPAR